MGYACKLSDSNWDINVVTTSPIVNQKYNKASGWKNLTIPRYPKYIFQMLVWSYCPWTIYKITNNLKYPYLNYSSTSTATLNNGVYNASIDSSGIISIGDRIKIVSNTLVQVNPYASANPSIFAIWC